MRITVENKEKELYNAFKSALISKGYNLSKFCEEFGYDYHNTRHALTASQVDLNFFKELHDKIGASCFYTLTINYYGKTIEYKS